MRVILAVHDDVHRAGGDVVDVDHAGQRVFDVKGMAKQATGMAIAATIATIAVVTVQNGKQDQQTETNLVANAGPTQVQQFTPVNAQGSARLSNNLEARLSGYLVNHNELSGRASVRTIPAYSRIVSITPGERIADE